jgi:phosphate transport system protein
MRAAFDRALTGLHDRLVALGGLVEAQLDAALAALARGDVDAAQGIAGRDRQIDEQAAAIDSGLLCTMARQAPVASDLRLLAGLLHINEHLERMGDLCVNLAKAIPELEVRPPPAEVRSTLAEMGTRVRQVVSAALACLADSDCVAAEELPALDAAVDRLNDRVFEQIERTADPTAAAWAARVVLVARFLERLGDQAVDVGEQVCFIVTGQVRELLPPKAARTPAGAGGGGGA